MKKTLLLCLCCGLITVLGATRPWETQAQRAPGRSQVLDISDTTLAVRLSDAQMSRQADVIAIGQAVDTKSVWIDRDLVTMVTISVSEVVKGDASSTITVVLPGGTDADRKFPVGVTWPGAPTIQPQEEVFLFLDSASDFPGGYTITGFAQGKFGIATDERGEKYVSRNLGGVGLVGPAGVTRGTAGMEHLSDFTEQVRGYVRQRDPGREPGTRNRQSIN